MIIESVAPDSCVNARYGCVLSWCQASFTDQLLTRVHRRLHGSCYADGCGPAHSRQQRAKDGAKGSGGQIGGVQELVSVVQDF